MSVREIPLLGHDGDAGDCDPRALRPADDNPRRQIGDLSSLKASIEAQGILEPLVVTPSGLIVAGHRRHAAALELDLELVPYRIRELDDAGRLEAMLAENLCREGITPLEEAAGYQQLVELGRTQRALAKQFDVSQGHVSKRLALLKLPAKAQTAVDAGRITIEQATSLAKLPTATVETLFKNGPPTSYAISDALASREKDEKLAKAYAKLKADGVTLLETAPRTWAPTSGQPGYGEPVRLDVLRHVDHAAHASEPCHAAWVSTWDARVVYACADPTRHPAPTPTDDDVADTAGVLDEVRSEARAAAEHNVARGEQLWARAEHRRDYLRQLIHTGPDLADVVSLFVYLMPDASDFTPDGPILEALGISPGHWDEQGAQWRAYIAKGANNEARALLAAAGTIAEMFMPATVAGLTGFEDYETLICRRWLTYLQANGYELDDDETDLLARLTGEEQDALEQAEPPEVTITTKGKGARTRWHLTCAACGPVGDGQTTEAFAGERRAAHLAEVHDVPDDRQTQLQGGGL